MCTRSAIARSREQPRQLDPFAKGKIANMHARVADAYAGIGMGEEAAREYRKALDLCPTFVDIRTKLASTLRDMGDKEGGGAGVSARQAAGAEVSAGAHQPRRDALLARAQGRGARAEWESVLAEDPGNKSCRMYLDILKG